jgi:ABC-2 type transport system ATP-binding protein
MVAVEQLVKTYGDLVAVDHISFAVQAGEIVGLLGPNGAGKTTTMRIITCFMPATAGHVRVAGHDVFTQSAAVRQRLGYMPENVPLYPEMRVAEYLRYRARLKGLRGQHLENRLQFVIEACELGEVHTRICDQLSKGNRQRVGLADALIGDPDLLILDEPTIGLDPNQVRRVRELILELGRNRTVILSTHILSEVEMMCQRVIIMHQGRIAMQDTMDSLRSSTKRVYHCEAKAPAREFEALLRAIPGLTDVTLAEQTGWTHATLRCALPDTDPREQIGAAARTKNLTLRALAVHEPALEDVFVEITAR